MSSKSLNNSSVAEACRRAYIDSGGRADLDLCDECRRLGLVCFKSLTAGDMLAARGIELRRGERFRIFASSRVTRRPLG